MVKRTSQGCHAAARRTTGRGPTGTSPDPGRGRIAGLLVTFILLLLAGGFAPQGPMVEVVAAAEADDGDGLPELTADEFVEWLDGKELAFLELWDPA